MAKLRVALCQINSVVGDITANTDRVLAGLAAAERAGCHAAVFPELAITGYPPEDLVLKRRFVEDSRRAMEHIAAKTGSCTAVVGFVDGADGCWNAAGIAADGHLLGVYHKRELPNYGVFDERRYFQPGAGELVPHDIAGVSVGVSICEDAWVAGGPMSQLAAAGAEVVFNLNASPYHVGKLDQRLGVLRERVADTGCPVVYTNLVGGQDELVFDGASLVMDGDGRVIAQAPPFQEHLLIAEIEVPAPSRVPSPLAIPNEINAVHSGLDELDEQYEALVLATRDYVQKNGFTDVGVGLSGGIDSSLVAVIAVDALGADHVHGVLMPSRYSSDHSLSDGRGPRPELGHRLPGDPGGAGPPGLSRHAGPRRSTGWTPTWPRRTCSPESGARCLWPLSNKFGWLILTTGNKSESAVGYSTLYGDTAGAYAVIKDLWKLQVYAFARHRNQRAGRDLIPEHVLVKPPSAELRPDQRDDQSLPSYDVLDPLLEAYVEGDLTPADLCAQGHDPELVSRITGLVDRAEYKRRQNPPGVRITAKAFGRDRRLPITNRYRGDG